MLVIHNLSFYGVALLSTASWMQYLCLNMLFTLAYCIYDQIFGRLQLSNRHSFVWQNTQTLLVFGVLFALNEKIRKEMFVLNLTNSKTKR